jgi:dimethylargininase
MVQANAVTLLAFTRAVPPSIQSCELTHLERQPIDHARAVEEHEQYEEALRGLGCRVERLPAAPELPDSVFVEDAAVVFDRVAVITRPGAASRRPEVDAVAAALAAHRPLAFIEAPGTLDGGDVLVTPGKVFVGISGRTNEEGVRQMAAIIAPHGFETIAVPVTGCLHLKSAVTVCLLPPSSFALRATEDEPGGRTALLINPAWVDAAFFDGFDLIEVDPAEPAAANVLLIGDTVLCADEHARTRRRLEARGFVTRSVPAGQLAKAEGGLSCCSLVLAT